MTTNNSTDWLPRRRGPTQNRLATGSGNSNWLRSRLATLLTLLGAACSLASTGCQVEVGGQTLPSGYYIQDDVQYFAPGPEFVLSQEAAAQKAFNAEVELQERP